MTTITILLVLASCGIASWQDDQATGQQEKIARIQSTNQLGAELARQLQKQLKPNRIEKVADQNALKVYFEDGGTLTIGLDNLWSGIKGRKAEEQHLAVLQMVESAKTAAKHKPTETAEEDKLARIMPLLKNKSYLEEYKKKAEGKSELMSEHLVADIHAVYVLDMPETMAMVTKRQAESLNLDEEKIRQLALENLRNRIPKYDIIGDRGIYGIAAGGNYEASFMLLPEFREKFAGQVKGNLVMMVPSRDILILIGDRDKEVLRKTMNYAKQVYLDTPYPISNRAIRTRDGKLTEFRE